MNPRIRFVVLLSVLLLIALSFYFATTRRERGLVLQSTVDANQVIVSSKVSGRIERLLATEGQEVKAGDLIAVIEGQDLTAERNASEAQRRAYLAQLAGSRASEQNTAGDVTASVANAQAALSSAQASLAEAVANRDRQATESKRTIALAAQGVMSAQDRDNAEQLLRAAEARVRAAADQTRSSEAQLASARAHLHQTQTARSNVASTAAQAAAAEAQLAEAETRLGYTKIYAPVSGRVSLWAAREGEVVAAGSAILTIVDLSQTWVYAPLPETYAAAVQLGDQLSVRMPDGSQTPGRVIAKMTEADFATQRDVSRRKRDIKTVRLKLLIENPGERYAPGMTAETILPEDKAKTR